MSDSILLPPPPNEDLIPLLQKIEQDLQDIKTGLASRAEDGKNEEKAGEKDPDKKEKKPLSKRKKIGIGAIVLLLLIGIGWFAHGQYKYENTDDAYVQANSTQLSPKVSAVVTHVLVAENDRVKAGQILAQLDASDYQTAMDDAVANQQATQTRMKTAESDYRRYQQMMRERAVTAQQFDHAQSEYRELERQVKSADAKVQQAKLNLEYTSLRAPVDGRIARRSVDVGMYVAAGTALFGFVPYDERWIDANYKESQLETIAIGKQARVKVDAIPGREFEGLVESISPATGSTFALLPPDNATGNFTKVTQRVPVRILLKNLKPEDYELLRAGLSANVNLLKHSDTQTLPSPAPPVFEPAQLAPTAAETAAARENPTPTPSSTGQNG